MEITLRKFTEQDYYAYQGIEGEAEIADLVLPLDGKRLEAQVVVDDNGINIIYWDGEDTMHDFRFELEGKGIARSKALLQVVGLDYGGVTVELLISLGFIYNKL